jgi:UPF0042 nucleotide-binding protein
MTPKQQKLVLVTGPAGAGRSTAINALEDFGYEAIDNIPLTLIPRLLQNSDTHHKPIALGIDTRNRDFSTQALMKTRDFCKELPYVESTLLFLDCDTATLGRRYSETRRRHPMAPHDSPHDGILRDKQMLSEVQQNADVLIDTSALTVHDLKAEMESHFLIGGSLGIAVSVQSFSYKRGLPQGLDMAFDCRFLRNPHWDPALRAHTGQTESVQKFVKADERFNGFYERILDLCQFTLPAYKAEGKAHFSIGFGCTGGKHRSVTLTETLASALAEEGWQVSIRHRELECSGQGKLQPPAQRHSGKAAQ